MFVEPRKQIWTVSVSLLGFSCLSALSGNHTVVTGRMVYCAAFLNQCSVIAGDSVSIIIKLGVLAYPGVRLKLASSQKIMCTRSQDTLTLQVAPEYFCCGASVSHKIDHGAGGDWHQMFFQRITIIWEKIITKFNGIYSTKPERKQKEQWSVTSSHLHKSWFGRWTMPLPYNLM